MKKRSESKKLCFVRNVMEEKCAECPPFFSFFFSPSLQSYAFFYVHNVLFSSSLISQKSFTIHDLTLLVFLFSCSTFLYIYIYIFALVPIVCRFVCVFFIFIFDIALILG